MKSKQCWQIWKSNHDPFMTTVSFASESAMTDKQKAINSISKEELMVIFVANVHVKTMDYISRHCGENSMDDTTFAVCQEAILKSAREYRRAFKEYFGRDYPIIWIKNEETGEVVLLTNDLSLGNMMIEYSKMI